ncbi:asparagine synthase-related protein [Natrononativus amylolyticus]|uniref:asparagine synthase-related protein n=1 Tax=Natrononativus amylolyticus TaxID=2963434 RepID=UPI0020CEBA7A|nr:asparagine synthase-related protein [Natrononativus amylolyticus]
MHLSLRADGWTRLPEAAVRGRAFDGDRLLEGRALAARLADAATGGLESVAAVAADLEGFYGAVLEAGETTYLVADGTRSIPLYYDAAGTAISDRGRLVRDAVGARRDRITESEFVLTRYVTGPETIWRGVLATQPGEVVALEAGSKPVRETYREYWPTGSRDESGGPSLEGAFETALDRLETVAGDRPVVVPLSGGYDSRLLAAALAARGREVIAYTFGRSGHPDVEVSREVAARLGIRWEFCEYDRTLWRDLYHGPAGERYRERAFGGDALPFLAEWPALRRLLEADRLPEDALYCPGHTVATPSERLPRFAGEAASTGSSGDAGCGPAVDADVAAEDGGEVVEPSLEGLLEYVLESHYVLWRRDTSDRAFDLAVRDRIRRGLIGGREPSDVDGPAAAAAAYERWEWRGRMATFTAGDLRVYEDCGVDWWLPLWDPAYVRAWAGVGLEDRRGKAAHAALARECYRRAADVPLERVALTDRSLSPSDRLLALCRHTPERQFAERGGDWAPPFQVSRSGWTTRGNHPLAWDAIVDSATWDRLPPFRNLYALRVLEATGRLELTAPDAEPNFEGIAATACDERTVD